MSEPTTDEGIAIYCWLCTRRIITTNDPAALGYALTDGISEHKHCRVAHELWLQEWREQGTAPDLRESKG